MKGRTPQPTVLKILKGTRKSRIPVVSTPKTEAPSCPDHLDRAARREWKRAAAELLDLGLLTRLDRAALAAYCVCWSRWAAAERQVEEQGAVVKSPNGYPIKNPYLSVAEESQRLMKSFATELGLSPASRTRIHIVRAPGEFVPKVAKRYR